MKQEFKVLIYSMINNLFISILKILGGFSFQLGSLFADGLHTFSDFFTDVMSLIGAKISRKKPTKLHPFGFGKVEYLTNLFMGIILFALSIFIIVNSFQEKKGTPHLSVLILLTIVFVLKLIAIIVMHKVGKKINSQVLITSVKESKVDLYSTIAVFIITILLQFTKQLPSLVYVDLIGSLFIGFIVLKTAFEIMISNSLSLIGEVEDDKEKIQKIKDFIAKEKEIHHFKMALIKYGAYYKLQLTIELNPKLSLLEVTQIENKLKRDLIRHRSFHIKYVTIFVTNKI